MARRSTIVSWSACLRSGASFQGATAAELSSRLGSSTAGLSSLHGLPATYRCAAVAAVTLLPLAALYHRCHRTLTGRSTGFWERRPCATRLQGSCRRNGLGCAVYTAHVASCAASRAVCVAFVPTACDPCLPRLVLLSSLPAICPRLFAQSAPDLLRLFAELGYGCRGGRHPVRVARVVLQQTGSCYYCSTQSLSLRSYTNYCPACGWLVHR